MTDNVEAQVLEELRVAFGPPRFTFHAARCLNSWQDEIDCLRCAEACPCNALYLEQGAVRVQETACVGCGACLSTCPTEALAETHNVEAALADALNHTTCVVLELICPLAVTPIRGRKTAALSVAPETAGRHQTPRCLGAFTPADLIALSRLGGHEVWLNDLHCADCPLGRAHSILQDASDEANAWLENYGDGSRLRLASEHLRATSVEPGWQSLSDAPVDSSRRAFLRMLVPGVNAGRPIPIQTTERSRHAQRVPHKRERLLQLLRNADAKPESLDARTLPIAAVQIDGCQCSACGLCAKFCPTGALHIVQDEELFGVFLTAGACIACGICATVCPESAMSYGALLSGAALLATQPEALLADALSHCAACGATLPSGAVHTECFVCRQRTVFTPVLEEWATNESSRRS